MSSNSSDIRIRTSCELIVLCGVVQCFLMVCSIIALFFVKTFGGAILVLLPPLLCMGLSFFVLRKNRKAIMMNVIDVEGVRNQYFGEPLCNISWDEIGDFGVAEIRTGLFEGRYIYMSRVFVPGFIRKDIIRRYDPRVCIIFPYTSEVCRAVAQLSGGRIEIR